MSRNRNNRNPGKYNYNRQSAGYQKNMYRQKLNQEGIKAPKSLNPKTIRYITIGVGIAWLVLSVVLILNFKWKGLLIGLLIALVIVGAGYFYLVNKENSMIRYYQKIGMTEEMYVNELKRRNTDKKQIERIRRKWRKLQG